MNAESFETGKQQLSSEQMAAIRSLDKPSVPESGSALSKLVVFITTALGILIASVLWKLLGPDLAWLVTCPPGSIALFYVSRRSVMGTPLQKSAMTLFSIVNGVYIGSAVWYLAHLAVKHHIL